MRCRAREALLLLVVVFGSILCHSDPPGQNATHALIITYKALLAHRIDLREYMLSEGIPHLTELQQRGVIDSYHVFFSRYVDDETWDMMLIVSFSHPADLAHWREVELRSPAALNSRGLAEIRSVTTAPVVRVRSVTSSQKPHDPVFLVIPYKILSPTADYINYFNGYVVPQLDGWRAENILLGYDLYTAQYPAGRPWGSMLVLQYADDTSLAERERIISEIRDRLRSNSSWRTFAENKTSVRTEEEAVVADELHAGK